MINWMKHTVLLALVLASFAGRAQDALLSPYWLSPVFVNPSETGNFEQSIRANAIYQNQWLSAGETFITSGAAVDVSLGKQSEKDSYLAFGATVLQDRAGTTNFGYMTGMATAAYHLKMGTKDKVSAGLQVGFIQHSMQNAGLKWDSQFNGVGYDPGLPSNENFNGEVRNFFDGAFGFNWQHTSNRDFRYSVGYAAHHVMQSQTLLEEGNGRLMMRHTIHGKLFTSFDWVKMQFHGRTMLQGGANYYEVGAMGEVRLGQDSKFTNYKTSSAVLGGVSVRLANAVVPMIGFELQRKFMIAMSYSFNIGKLTNYSRGFETLGINLTYKGWLSQNRKKIN